jgi:hypothetical protein
VGRVCRREPSSLRGARLTAARSGRSHRKAGHFLIGWKGCIREGTRGRAFAAPAPATAIAARRCNVMATANETWTVCRSKTAFCLRFGGRGVDRLQTSQPIALAFASLGLDDLFVAQIDLDPKAELRSLTNGLPSRTNVCTRRKRTCGPQGGSPGSKAEVTLR